MLYAVDSMTDAEPNSDQIKIVGWICGTQDKPKVRARIADCFFEGVSGLPRPDVAIAHPNSFWSGESGFAVSIRGRPGE